MTTATSPFQAYNEKLCKNLRAEKMRRGLEKFTAPREQVVRRVGVVSVGAAMCACGRRIEPADFEAVSTTQVRAVCPKCHRDLLEIRRTWREVDDTEGGQG